MCAMSLNALSSSSVFVWRGEFIECLKYLSKIGGMCDSTESSGTEMSFFYDAGTGGPSSGDGERYGPG